MAKKFLTISNATIIFRNFAGKEGKFNPPGNRNFCVLLDDEVAEQLKADSWNVKYLMPKDEDQDPQPYIQVKVKYDRIPPKIVVLMGSNKRVLKEEDVAQLDWAEIENVDLTINPHNYDVRGTVGVSGYLRSMYVTLVEDELERKYADAPESNAYIYGDNDD